LIHFLDKIKSHEFQIKNLTQSIAITQDKMEKSVQSKYRKLYTSVFPDFYDLYTQQMEKEDYEKSLAALDRKITDLREDYAFYNLNNDEDFSF
jgi:hypothetical protein